MTEISGVVLSCFTLTNNSSGVNTEIKVNGQKLETVTSFKYLAQLELMRVPSLRYSPG